MLFRMPRPGSSQVKRRNEGGDPGTKLCVVTRTLACRTIVTGVNFVGMRLIGAVKRAVRAAGAADVVCLTGPSGRLR